MPVRRLLSELSASELTDYMAFDRIEPFGEVRADLRAGIVASTVANHGMSPPKEAARPIDFMPLQNKRGPLEVADRDEHAKLMAATLFGDNVKK
jgi:hypothetical protein